ncbi:MAG: MBL fold metallo-hydrolase [Antarcticimicrobium sp.]|uniref:MBL fold metallo-hydrolase n=1 Tax=Antarcticimicrobium sp. TaxID=2824147 RepID=UPI0026293DCC|nr:MBL fold metallo-hydrolase [Antarcticimicrobium sp.]MDF1717345.1 MBL fold metallo-hydrolase [Antarcticimicrobium sp.]
MKLTLLGTGSPEAYVRRASSGYLLEVGDDKILFDCGGGVFDNLLRAGYRPGDITHLFFSHLHSDHMMDYARLAHAAWDEGAPPLKVWGPAPIARITEGYFGRGGVLSADLYARTELPPSQQVWVARGGTLPRPWPAPEVTEITPGFACQGDGWTLQSCEVPHAQPAFDCMGFSVTAGGRKFVYSGDAGICDALTDLSRDADLLLHWCYRLSGEEIHPAIAAFSPTPADIARMAQSAGVKRLLISHFRIHMDSEEGHAGARADLAAHFDGPAEIAEDLQVHEI